MEGASHITGEADSENSARRASIGLDNRPLNFHWTTTVALDGTVTNTPMVIEQPQ